MAAEYRSRGIEVVLQHERRLINEERLQATMEAVREFQPTVVVSWTGAPAYEALRYVPAGVLRIGVLHSDHEDVYQQAKPYESCMDRIVVLSQRMVEASLASLRCPAGKILYNRLGVHLAPAGQRREPNAGRPLRILYLGRLLHHQKRVRLFPEILRQLCATGMPFVWTLAGDGPDRAYLKQTLVTNNPTQIVRVLGNVPYAQISALLAEQDVFLLASDFEGLPHTLLEAMGHGLVPVVSDLPSGIREVVDESNGLLVDVNDIAGYARAIHWLHTHRPELASMSRAAERRVREGFSVSAMTDQWMAMLSVPATVALHWPRSFQFKVPLVHSQPWSFHQPFRTVRRIIKRL